jgi:hypothetical protein
MNVLKQSDDNSHAIVIAGGIGHGESGDSHRVIDPAIAQAFAGIAETPARSATSA